MTSLLYLWRSYVRKPEYVGFLIDRGSTLIDTAGGNGVPSGAGASKPLPRAPYIVNSVPA